MRRDKKVGGVVEFNPCSRGSISNWPFLKRPITLTIGSENKCNLRTYKRGCAV